MTIVNCRLETEASSIIASVFAFHKRRFSYEINAVFLTLTNATTIIYSIVYVLIAISLIKLRKSQPDTLRPYRIGKKGNGLAYLVAAMLIFSVIIVIFATLGTTTVTDAVLVALITIVMFVIPLIINRFKKASWATEVKEDLGE